MRRNRLRHAAILSMAFSTGCVVIVERARQPSKIMTGICIGYCFQIWVTIRRRMVWSPSGMPSRTGRKSVRLANSRTWQQPCARICGTWAPTELPTGACCYAHLDDSALRDAAAQAAIVIARAMGYRAEPPPAPCEAEHDETLAAMPEFPSSRGPAALDGGRNPLRQESGDTEQSDRTEAPDGTGELPRRPTLDWL